MKWDNRGQTYTLTSGRRIYANHGILGLAPGDDTLHEGYDGCVNDWDHDTGELLPLTADERCEIANAMIARWAAWAGAVR